VAAPRAGTVRRGVPLPVLPLVGLAGAVAALLTTLIAPAAVLVPALVAVVVGVLIAHLIRTWAATSVAAEQDRLVRELHDVVLQDLAGIGYALGALERESHDRRGQAGRTGLPGPAGSGPAGPGQVPRRLGEVVRYDVGVLQAMLTDLRPPRA
jgi:hypothetical protein